MNCKPSIYIFGIILFGIYSIIYYFNSNAPTLNSVSILGVFSILQLIYSLISWKKIGYQLFDAYVVFIVAFYMFNVGQTITEALGFTADYRRLWNDFGLTSTQYYDAAYYSLASLLLFHFGAIAATSSNDSSIEVHSSINTFNSIKKAAIICALCSAPFYLYNLLQQIAIVESIGYKGLYNVEYTTRTYSIIAELFPPAMILLYYVSNCTNEKKKIITLITFVCLFVPPLYLGGRSNAMILASIFLVIYISIHSIRRKQLILILCGGVLLLILMNIVANIRTGTERSFQTIMNGLSEDNSILLTIQEMGWSMYPLAISMEAVPSSHDFTYGSSFFWTIVSIIPNIGFWSGAHPAQVHDMANYINEYSSLGYGIGYSLIAQCWNDFGVFGPFAIAIIGYLFAKAFNGISSYNVIYYPIKFAMSILFLWFAIKCVRNGMYGLARGGVYYMLPIYLLTKMFMKGRYR